MVQGALPQSLRRAVLVAVAALAGAACTSHNFVSPTAEQGPPPFVGPPQESADTGNPPMPLPAASAAASAPVNITFYKTQDSNDWVNHTFKVQKTYSRVIAVNASGTAPAKVTVGTLDLNGDPTQQKPVELAVTTTVKTLEEAAKAAHGGDLIVVLPGKYQGFTLGDKPDAGDGRYIHWKALGAPGEVVIDRAAPTDRNWMIVLLGAHHVIIEGFNIAGTNAPGKAPEGPNAGIIINGNFLDTSKLSHHIAIVNNFSHDHKKWGLHSVDSNTVLIENNLFSGSAMEHGAYISDGSDNYVIRRNVFFANNASGVQVNVDPLASLEKLKEHPDLKEKVTYKQNREFALTILRLATERFGQNAFPDGRGFNYIIEDNVSNGNGRAGGGAINLAGVRESLIQNNLLYGNAASGIVEWDNANPFDAAQADPGPKSVADMTGPDVLPIFGCFSNVIRNNTVLTTTRSRPSLLVTNGSWGAKVRNNILINESTPSIQISNTSIWRFDASHNVLGNIVYDGNTASLRSLALSLPDEPRSVIAVNRAKIAGQVERDSDEPWVIIDKGWWKLNPKRPSFRPRSVVVSPLLAGRGDPKEMPKTDLEGRPRRAADIGAFAAME